MVVGVGFDAGAVSVDDRGSVEGVVSVGVAGSARPAG